jgi:hypothetical protein
MIRGVEATYVAAGPYAGYLLHGGESCCIARAHALLPGAGALLGLAIVAPFASSPFAGASRATYVTRVAAWCVGWSGWFLSGWLSFAHVG